MAADITTPKALGHAPEKIAEAVSRLVAVASLRAQVLAIGAAATGDLTSASDLDLLVIQFQAPDACGRLCIYADADRSEHDKPRPLLRKAMQDLTLPERLIGDPVMEVARLGFHGHQAETLSEGWAVA